jgi:hypothetical protein
MCAIVARVGNAYIIIKMLIKVYNRRLLQKNVTIIKESAASIFWQQFLLAFVLSVLLLDKLTTLVVFHYASV